MLGEHPQGHSLTPKGIQQDMPQGHCSRGSPQGGQRPAEITGVCGRRLANQVNTRL
jgi:hypothetical protein